MDFNRIYNVAERINALGRRDLSNRVLLEDLIRAWGLHDDPAIDFGAVNEPYRTHLGMIQQPEQLAPALIFLSKYPISKYLELGAFSGSTCTFISLYLSKFNPNFHTLAVDRDMDFDDKLIVLANQYARLDFKRDTSDDLKGYKSDLCFIDADHKYESVKLDYENVGRHSKICMLHDIIDEGTVKERDDSGTVHFWDELKDSKCYEFIDHPESKKVMGIGIICQLP